MKIADGVHVPEGATAEGSTFSLTSDGPDGTTQTCTATGAPDENGIIYCTPPGEMANLLGASPAGLLPIQPAADTFTAPAGSTVTITQISAPDSLVLDSTSQQLDPCTQSSARPGLVRNTKVTTIEPCEADR